jgi:DNA-binding response OmpR family regulator
MTLSWYAKFMDTSQKKVVIVEDDKMLAEIYQTLLASNGFNALVANDGRTGADLIKEEQPDLVLLDLMLPELSGDMVLYEIRSDERTRATKVIMLTNISETEAPEGLDKLGFSRYIVKANLISNQLPDICNEVIAETPDQSAEAVAL